MVQHQPWWTGSLQDVGNAVQEMQKNMQHFADEIAQWSTARSPTRHSSLTVATEPQSKAILHSSGQHARSSSSSSNSSIGNNRQQYVDIAALSSRSSPQQVSQQPVTKEELGRATWLFLHTLAAQYPEHPSRQQQRDARQLIDSLTRLYPCGDCAQHFQELVKREPPAVNNGRDFALWMCRTHNAVNRRLGKPTFNCDVAAARWAPLNCDEHNSCDMTVGRKK